MAADLATLTGLLERVQAAMGPDRELDVAIYFALECVPIPDAGVEILPGLRIQPGDYGYRYMREGAPVDGTLSPRFTAEERHHEQLIAFLPGGWQVCTMTPDPTRSGHHKRAWAKIQPCLANDDGWRIGARDCTAPTLALALTTAALMCLTAQAALIAQTEEPRHG